MQSAINEAHSQRQSRKDGQQQQHLEQNVRKHGKHNEIAPKNDRCTSSLIFSVYELPMYELPLTRFYEASEPNKEIET
jgi:hypothetical protein